MASLLFQVACVVGALLISRLALKSRGAIWLTAVFGAAGAMYAHAMVDGQGAFLLLVFAPVIYFLAVRGRQDLRA